MAVTYGYQDFPDGTDEEAALERILQDAWDDDIRYMTNQDISTTPQADQWANGTDMASELERMMDVRAAALSHFGETAIKNGTPMAKIEEVLKREFFWTVPYDNRVRVGSQIGKPAVLASPDSPGSKSLMELAKAVTGSGSTPGGSTVQKKGRSWPFRRKRVSSSAQVAEGG